MTEPTRIYSNRETSVEWRPELCMHCEYCFLWILVVAVVIIAAIKFVAGL